MKRTCYVCQDRQPRSAKRRCDACVSRMFFRKYSISTCLCGCNEPIHVGLLSLECYEVELRKQKSGMSSLIDACPLIYRKPKVRPPAPYLGKEAIGLQPDMLFRNEMVCAIKLCRHFPLIGEGME